jgi:hypothetical protein
LMPRMKTKINWMTGLKVWDFVETIIVN